MIGWLSEFMIDDDAKVIYLLTLILVANVIDMSMGWLNAKFNVSVAFSSSKAIYGIARKMFMFILAVFFVPVSLLVPPPVGIGALYVFLFGYLASEINSILSHMRLSDDDKSTDRFADFVNKVLKGENKNE